MVKGKQGNRISFRNVKRLDRINYEWQIFLLAVIQQNGVILIRSWQDIDNLLSIMVKGGFMMAVVFIPIMKRKVR